jgi:hypothetical protein
VQSGSSTATAVLERSHVRLVPALPATPFDQRAALQRPVQPSLGSRRESGTPKQAAITVQVNSCRLGDRRAVALPNASLFGPRSWSRMRALRAPGWADVVTSALLILAVAVPTVTIEEGWHGRPMIDLPAQSWIIALGLVAAAFFAGGVVVAFRRPSKPIRYAAATAALAVGVLVVGTVSWSLFVVHEHVPGPLPRVWILGVIMAPMMSVTGSLLGRFLTR